jgi:sterol desaturase/sphingolipid hydroxylase (fatty acid hydroxylase superfamily)
MMKKIIGILSVALLPTISFAQNYSFRMMDNGFDYGNSLWVLPFVFLIPLIWLCFVVGIFIFWLIMLIDAIKNAPEKMKLIWVIVIIFTCIVGAFIYYFVEKRPRNKIAKEKEHKKEENK